MMRSERKTEDRYIETETMENTEKSRKRGEVPRWYKPVLIFLIFVIMGSSGLLIYHGTKGYYPWGTRGDAKFSEGMDDDRILKALQEATDKSSFQFRINSRPVFAGSSAKGPLFIENPKENRFLMRVNIRLKETGETVYKTKAIRPGYGIGSDRLSKKLPAGEHEAVAVITAVDPENGRTAGSAQAKLSLIIKEKGEE